MTTKTSSTELQPTTRDRLVVFLQEYGAQLAFGPALAALLGSLYYSEIAGFVPCTLCWYQRILMYPLSVIIIVGVFNGDRLLPRYVLPLSITGIAVSGYHYLLQNHVFGGGSTICSTGVSCAARYVNMYGFITIPFMALIAFTLITGLMIAANWSYRQDVEWDEAE